MWFALPAAPVTGMHSFTDMGCMTFAAEFFIGFVAAAHFAVMAVLFHRLTSLLRLTLLLRVGMDSSFLVRCSRIFSNACRCSSGRLREG